MILTAPQITYLGMNGNKLEIAQKGKCRICGGPLLGSIKDANKAINFKSWTDEVFISTPDSNLICEPCVEIKKIYSKNIFKGFVATSQSIKWFETAQDILDALGNLPDDPFVLLIKTWGGMYRKHIIPFSPVNYNKEQVSAMVVFHPWQQHAKDSSMTACTFTFLPQKVLEIVDKLQNEEGIHMVNPAHHGIEKHLATYIVSTLNRENSKKAKGVG